MAQEKLSEDIRQEMHGRTSHQHSPALGSCRKVRTEEGQAKAEGSIKTKEGFTYG